VDHPDDLVQITIVEAILFFGIDAMDHDQFVFWIDPEHMDADAGVIKRRSLLAGFGNQNVPQHAVGQAIFRLDDRIGLRA